MEPEKTPNSQSNLEKDQSRRHHNSGLEATLQSCNHQDSRYWHKNRHSDQLNRIENPKMDTQTYGQLIFDKAGKISSERKTVSPASGAGKTGYQHAEK